MHLTAALNVIRRKLFKGNMFRGKYRYVKPVKLRDMIMLEEEYKREERVMKLLLNPYLSVVCVKCTSTSIQYYYQLLILFVDISGRV